MPFIVPTSGSLLKNDYISICGNRDPVRYGSDRKINIVNFLPQYLHSENEVVLFTQFFENYLNEMFDGYPGYTVTSADTNDLYGGTTSLSATAIPVNSYTNTMTSANKISILEKIYRLTDTHNPDLIDIDYIQHFAANLGYNIGINKDELGTIEDGTTCSKYIQEKYLRFVVSNLPHWYKIKTTQNAVKIMLFSFGLVGDIINYYTNDYDRTWLYSKIEWDYSINQLKENLDSIPNDYYPTPHFGILFNINRSDTTNYNFALSTQKNVINAIQSIKPINTVFRGLHSWMIANANLYLTPIVRYRKHISLISTSYADSWVV